jgi:serine/threonine protein kinase
MHITLANEFKTLKSFALNLKERFETEGDFLKKGRNQIKVIGTNKTQVCIKKFGKPTLLNILIYSFFRKSKAERSYLCAQNFLKLGIHTPRPIGFIEEYNRWNILTQSYYLSEYEDSLFTMAEVFNQSIPNSEQIIKEFIDFAVDKLHNNGIFHRDFNGANTMVSQLPDGRYSFSIVDLNRVRFNRKMGYKNSLRHLKGLCANPHALTLIGHYYAQKLHKDPTHTTLELIAIKYSTLKKRKVEKRILHSIKHILQSSKALVR